MRLKKNTSQGWNELYENLLQSRESVIEIEMTEAMGNMLNLKYFLPIAERLHRMQVVNGSRQLLLKIIPGEDDEKRNIADIIRLSRFFSEWRLNPYIKIQIGAKELLSEPWKTNRIFPICQVSNVKEGLDSSHCISYQSLTKCYYNNDSRMNQIAGEDANCLVQYGNELLQWIQDEESFVGTGKRKLKREQKAALRDMVVELVFCHLSSMSVLAQVIWLYILRELIETKQLYGLPMKKAENTEKEEKLSVYRNVITKSRMDAVSYAEGLYQVIENACFYSEDGQAWFGIRMHRAGKKVALNELGEEVRTREALYAKYARCFSVKNEETGKLSVLANNIFTQGDEYRFYFEFYVIDNSSSRTGIVATYNDKVKKIGKAPIKHMGEIFNIKPESANQNLEQHIEDVTVHYGMRVLRHIVETNHGYLMGASPAPSYGTQYYYSRELPYEVSDEEIPYTEWNAILPIYYRWEQNMENSEKALSAYDGRDCFGMVLEPPEKMIYMSEKAIFYYDSVIDKKDKIQKIKSNLFKCLESYTRNKIILFQFGKEYLDQIEYFAKALFALIAKVAAEELKSDGFLISLIMPDMEAIQEFIRFFSMFYYDGEQEDMRNVQIALCSMRDAEEGTLKGIKYGIVEFMLAGESISSAMETARLFAYHHAEDTLEHIPMLEYLTDYAELKEGGNQMENNGGEKISLCPFDLFLPCSLPMDSREVQNVDLNIYESWFVSRTSHVIESDLRANEYGCKIDNVHVRLGSKVHITSFYEAELLFHNTGNISRFAYYIAMNLLYGDEHLQNGGKVLILGYEKYSAILIMQLQYLLEQSGDLDGVYAAVVHDDDEGEITLRTYFDKEKFPDKSGFSTQIVTVLPVGTTLSTVYKMHNVARRELGWNWGDGSRGSDNEHNFCLVLVNEDLDKNSGGGSSITNMFWSMPPDLKNHLVEINNENHDTSSCKVRYLIPAFAQWYSPETCPICKKQGKNNRPLIDAKHAETMPSAIFKLYDYKSRRKIKERTRKNAARLLHYVSYAHLCSGNNHFQFFIDFQGLYFRNKEDIDKELLTCPIDRSSYHVVVSPLNINNSGFVKAVLDCVFKGCARFFHIDISDAYREEVRSKFSYIAQDYKLLKQSNPNMHFHIYYVDNSIVTGENLNRAKLLLLMLISQEMKDMNTHFSLFDKIFLFVNRCHEDTLRTFVNDVEKDVYNYIHLDIPSYNTSNDFCPACKTQRKYTLMGKRSSTINLNVEFVRLSQKHDKRSLEEYNIWLEETIIKSPSYFSWFLRWLYVNVPTGQNKIFSYVPEEEMLRYSVSGKKHVSDELYGEYTEHLEHVIKYVENYVKQMASTDGTSLADVMDYIDGNDSEKEKFRISAIKIIREQLIEVRDYMRLYSMQRAYEKLNAIMAKPDDYVNYPYRSVMLAMIADKLYPLEKEKTVKLQIEQISGVIERRFAIGHNVEWMISYIKVLSREQIAYYYDYRQAIIGIMEDMLIIMHGGEERKQKVYNLKRENSNWSKIIDTIFVLADDDNANAGNIRVFALFYYQLYMTLIQRLSDLQVTLGVDDEGALKIISVYGRLMKCFSTKESEANATFICCPSKEQLRLRYLKAVKIATMTSNDANPCLMLAEASKKLNARSVETSTEMKEMLIQCARLLYLENTQMMYVGMRCLNRLLLDDISSIKEDDEFALLKTFEPSYRFGEYMDLVAKLVKKYLLNSYSNVDADAKEEDLLRQNVLYNFCSFWYRSTKESPVSQHSNEAYKIAYMLQYFRRLDKLSGEKLTPENKDMLPYEYEELCRCICGFTGFHMCYMVHFQQEEYPAIFAQSGYNVKLFRQGKIITPDKMEEILSMVVSKMKEQETDKSVDYREIKCPVPNILMVKEEDECLLILGLKAPDDDGDTISLYIVMQSSGMKNELTGKWSEDTVLRKARDVLFMRQTLQEILHRDYALLVNYRYDCSYVRPVCLNKVVQPSILHISDIHIQDESEEWIDSAGGLVKKAIRKADINSGVDLLVVTGDIIDGKKADAAAVEKRYKTAEALLRNIAIELWEDQRGYLPHDWKRRIIITTGNHDFASMNQYKPVMNHRALNPAIPADSDGGTMSKFAYFIDFLVRFLDAPVDMLLKNDLNEVRQYKKLKLKVLSLNCSSTATSRRANKIGINREKLSFLLKKQSWVETDDHYLRICAAHYSPQYELSYFLDTYEKIPGWEWRPEFANECQINKLVYTFCNAMVHELEYLLLIEQALEEETSKKSAIDFEKAEEKIIKVRKGMKKLMETLNVCLKALENSVEGGLSGEALKYYDALIKSADSNPKGSYKAIAEKIRKNEIYRNIKYYCEWMDKNDGNPDFNDERMSKLIHDISECELMSRYDKRVFEEAVADICKIAPINLYIAGHIHAYAEYKYQDDNSEKTATRASGGKQNSIQHILVADCFHVEGRNGVCGYLIKNVSVNRNKVEMEVHRLDE